MESLLKNRRITINAHTRRFVRPLKPRVSLVTSKIAGIPKWGPRTVMGLMFVTRNSIIFKFDRQLSSQQLKDIFNYK